MGFIDAPLKDSKAHPEHPIVLTSVDKPFYCDGCYEPGIGLCYRCKEPSGKCGKIFHEECGRAEEITTHPFSRGCHFTFSRPKKDASATPQQNTVYRICDVCCSEVKGFFYVCHKHGHFIHPSCMKLENRIDLSGFQLELKGTVPEKCGLCEHKHAFGGRKGWSYVSTCGRLCLHIKCVKKIFLDDWKKMHFGHNSIASSSSTPAVTITSMPMKMIAGVPSGTHAVHNTDSGKGQALVLARTSTSSIKKHAVNFIKLLKLAFPAIISLIFGTSAAPLAGNVIEALTAS